MKAFLYVLLRMLHIINEKTQFLFGILRTYNLIKSHIRPFRLSKNTPGINTFYCIAELKICQNDFRRCPILC